MSLEEIKVVVTKDDVHVEVLDTANKFRFRLVHKDGRLTHWCAYQETCFIDDYVAVTPYYTSSSEIQILSCKEYVNVSCTGVVNTATEITTLSQLKEVYGGTWLKFSHFDKGNITFTSSKPHIEFTVASYTYLDNVYAAHDYSLNCILSVLSEYQEVSEENEVKDSITVFFNGNAISIDEI